MSLVVNVQTLGGLLPIAVPLDATVRDLKARLQAIDSSFVFRCQKLFIATEHSDSDSIIQTDELHNNQTLVSYQITSHTQVVLIMMAPPRIKSSARRKPFEIDGTALQKHLDELLIDKKLVAISVESDVICDFKNQLLSLLSQNRSIQFVQVSIEGKFEAQQIRFCKSFVSKRPDIELKLCIHKTEGSVVQQILELCKFNSLAVEFRQCFEWFAATPLFKPTFQSMTALEYLDLSHNEISTHKCATLLASALSSLVQLQVLDLSETKLDDFGCERLAPALHSLTSIQWLGLHKNRIGEVGCIALAPALLSMTSVTELDLSYNRINSAGCAALAPGLQMMTSLEFLSLKDNQIGDEGWIALALTLQSLTTLRELNFQSNQIDDAGCAALAVAFQSLTSLETLGMNDNEIGCEGCEALAPVLPQMTALKSLDLSFNGIGLDGCVALANALPHMERLKSFHIVDNPLPGKSIDLLASVLRNTGICWDFDGW